MRSVLSKRASGGLAEAQRIAQLGSFEFDVVTGETTCSEEHFRILGLRPGSAASTPSCSSRCCIQTIGNVFGQAWAEATERGVPFDVAFRIIRPDSRGSVDPRPGVA